MTYELDLLDMVRLRVQGDDITTSYWGGLSPAGRVLRNLLANPHATIGVWGWRTDVGTLQRTFSGGGINPPTIFRATIGASQTSAYSEAVAVVPGQYVSAGVSFHSSTATVYHRVAIRFYRADGTLLSSATPSALAAGAGAQRTGQFQVPANAATARLVLEVSSSGAGMVTPPAGGTLQWREAYVVMDPVEAEVTPPALPDPLEWWGYPDWVDIMGSSVNLGTQRRAFDQTLTAVIRDADLDPAAVDTLRTGRPLIVETRANAGSSTWRPLFTGQVLKATTDYGDLKRNARPTITLTGTGNGAVLAGTPCLRGASNFDGFPELMEGVLVPYRLNGSNDQVPGAFAQVSANDQASVLDQVILTRDSVLGYAWVDVSGRLVAITDRSQSYGSWELDESHYSALAVSYDTDACINTVTVVLLRFNASTGETEEVTYGPYVDAASRRDFGVQSAEFRVHGVADPAAYAAAILAANATPKRRVDSVRIPIKADAQVGILVDLYDQVRVTNAALGLDLDLRPTGVDHSMDSRGRWYVDLQFASEDSVASPVATTPLPAGNGLLDGVWYQVGAAGAAAFAGAWVNSGGADMTVRYMRKNGRVYIDGLAKSGALGTNVFVLPVGFRPSANTQRATIASGNVVGRLSIGANGAVQAVSGSNTWISMACDFEAEA